MIFGLLRILNVQPDWWARGYWFDFKTASCSLINKSLSWKISTLSNNL